MEDLWQSCMEQVYMCHVSNIICSLSFSVSHFSNSHNFSIILLVYLLWWSVLVILNVTIIIVLGLHEPFSCKTVNFKTRDMFLAIATSLFFIFLSLFHSGLLNLWDTILKLGPLIILQRLLFERSSCVSLTWNQKLVVIKFSEEVMS